MSENTPTIPAPQAGDTRRAYCVRLGLAKETRGKFSKDALVAIAHAEAGGFVFAEPVIKPAAPKAAKATTVSPAQVPSAPAAPAPVVAKADTSSLNAKEVRAWAKANGHAVGQRGRINPVVIAAYVKANGLPVGPRAKRVTPLDMPKVRRETSGFTVERGTLIRQDSCGTVGKDGTKHSVSRCPCPGGPKAYDFLGGQPLTLDKPASL